MSPGFQLFPEQASTMASRVDALYLFLVSISIFFSVLIFTLIIYFAIKYRRRAEDEPPPPQMRDILALEVTWIVVPLILTLIAFFWGANVFYALARPPQPEETERLVTLVERSAALRDAGSANLLQCQPAWQDAAHAVFNLKEFIYVP